MSNISKNANKDFVRIPIIYSLLRGGLKIIYAFTEDTISPKNLNCIQDKTLDFQLIENDVKEICRQDEEGNKACVFGVFLDFEKKEIIFEIYTRRGKNFFKDTITGAFEKSKNLPEDIQKELEIQKRMTLKFFEEEEQEEDEE